MKQLIAILTLLGSFTAHAATERNTVNTLITCQQDDGDQWLEVGVVLNDGPGLRILVVAHNTDDNSTTLVADRRVSQKTVEQQTIFMDARATISLTLSKNNERGSLAMLQDGFGGTIQNDLYCYTNSEITLP